MTTQQQTKPVMSAEAVFNDLVDGINLYIHRKIKIEELHKESIEILNEWKAQLKQSPIGEVPDEGLVFCLERCLEWLVVKGPHTQELFERINYFINKYKSATAGKQGE